MVMADDVSRQRKRQRRKQWERWRQQRKSPRRSRSRHVAPTPAQEATDHQKTKIQEKDITGLKYFDKLAPLLERLHDDACQRDKADHCCAAVPDRQWHFDQYCLLVLLYLFNPIVTSLRGMQQASELGQVQRKLGVARAALGSLSEAASVFDPQRLKEIIAELGEELQPLGRDARLQDIDKTLTLVDGTLMCSSQHPTRCCVFVGIIPAKE
jgi:hypothetical protein